MKSLPFALSLGLVALVPSFVSAQIAVFDFQDAWSGSKETDFNVVAADSASIDGDVSSTVSLLANSGFTSGGFQSFSLDHEVFDTSATPSVGLNVGGANQATPTHYLSFTVTPEAGETIDYSSFSCYSDTAASSDDYHLELVLVDGGGAPALLGTHTHASDGVTNEPVHFVNFDFADFSSSNVTEWRLYAYGTDDANSGVRFDDLTLLGPEEVEAPTHYRVYFLGGQSNATGRGNAAELVDPLASEQTDVAFYMHTSLAGVTNLGHLAEDAWIKLAPGSGHGVTTPVSDKEFGSELSFGRVMADSLPTDNIAIIKYTHGGSNLHTQWADGGPMYNTFVDTADEALAALTAAGDTYELAGMLWHQGEADTGATNAANYEANLESLIARVRSDVFGGVTAPFIVAGLSDSQNSSVNTPGSGYYVVRQAQEAVAANGMQVGFVDTDGFAVRPTDTIHLNTEGQIALGEAFAAQMLQVEGEDEDSDGLSTDQEAALGTDPTLADTDGDGQDDGFEYRAGTDPLSAGSFFAINVIEVDDGTVSLSWPSQAGNEYQVERSLNLVDWTTLETSFAADAVASMTTWTGSSNVSESNSPVLARYDASFGVNGDFDNESFDSVDSDAGSVATRLVQGGSLTGGGAANFILANAVFDSSESGSPGFNLAEVGGADRAAALAAGDYFSFTTGASGQEVSYEKLSYYSNQFSTGSTVDISATIGGVETFLLEGFVPTGSNVAVTFHEVDFADFSTNQDVTWTFYIYGVSNATHGTRFDDISLMGESPIVDADTAPAVFYRTLLLP